MVPRELNCRGVGFVEVDCSAGGFGYWLAISVVLTVRCLRLAAQYQGASAKMPRKANGTLPSTQSLGNCEHNIDTIDARPLCLRWRMPLLRSQRIVAAPLCRLAVTDIALAAQARWKYIRTESRQNAITALLVRGSSLYGGAEAVARTLALRPWATGMCVLLPATATSTRCGLRLDRTESLQNIRARCRWLRKWSLRVGKLHSRSIRRFC
jgi:hypothetical protein